MDGREVLEKANAARHAADRWKDREKAREDLRQILTELMQYRTMVEISRITGIKRTTLYYIMYGSIGKNRQEAA